MAIHSYIEPHEYGLRQSLKALLARLLRGEGKFTIFFYYDELPRKEVKELIQRIVAAAGGTRQEDGRYLIASGLSSWRDLSVDFSQGLAPSSGTIISCQGKKGFVNKISRMLREEKTRRKHPGKKRTTLIGVGTGTWTRS